MRIHQLTTWDQADEVGYTAFFSSIHTELVATVYSNGAGFFQVELPPGSYSLFAVEDTLFYADRFDGSGYINPVVVKEGQVTEAHFDIDYMAAW
jgi:hypothetical protein